MQFDMGLTYTGLIKKCRPQNFDPNILLARIPVEAGLGELGKVVVPTRTFMLSEKCKNAAMADLCSDHPDQSDSLVGRFEFPGRYYGSAKSLRCHGSRIVPLVAKAEKEKAEGWFGNLES
jgi:hypothetical protein